MLHYGVQPDISTSRVNGEMGQNEWPSDDFSLNSYKDTYFTHISSYFSIFHLYFYLGTWRPIIVSNCLLMFLLTPNFNVLRLPNIGAWPVTCCWMLATWGAKKKRPGCWPKRSKMCLLNFIESYLVILEYASESDMGVGIDSAAWLYNYGIQCGHLTLSSQNVSGSSLARSHLHLLAPLWRLLELLWCHRLYLKTL